MIRYITEDLEIDSDNFHESFHEYFHKYLRMF